MIDISDMKRAEKLSPSFIKAFEVVISCQEKQFLDFVDKAETKI